MFIHRCLPEGGSDDERSPESGFSPLAASADELPYRVEIWDPTNTFVEQVIAVAANATIGYAAYYAAVRDEMGRHITLKLNGEVLVRWSRRSH